MRPQFPEDVLAVRRHRILRHAQALSHRLDRQSLTHQQENVSLFGAESWHFLHRPLVCLHIVCYNFSPRDVLYAEYVILLVWLSGGDA